MGGVTADKNGVVRMAPPKREITAERTKENNREFGNASKQAKVIRSALAPLEIRAKLLAARLTKKVREGIGLDNTNPRGERVLSKREATIVLPGFQINDTTNVESVASIVATVANGRLTVQRVGGGNPTIQDFRLPPGATDVDMVGLVSQVNINTEVLQVLNIQTSVSTRGQEIVLPPMTVTPNPNKDIITIVAIAVRFFQEVNGSLYPLDNRAYDVGKIVTVL
jgi:hypothetical protein